MLAGSSLCGVSRHKSGGYLRAAVLPETWIPLTSSCGCWPNSVPLGTEYGNSVITMFITQLQKKFKRKKAFNNYIEIEKKKKELSWGSCHGISHKLQ